MSAGVRQLSLTMLLAAARHSVVVMTAASVTCTAAAAARDSMPARQRRQLPPCVGVQNAWVSEVSRVHPYTGVT